MKTVSRTCYLTVFILIFIIVFEITLVENDRRFHRHNIPANVVYENRRDYIDCIETLGTVGDFDIEGNGIDAFVHSYNRWSKRTFAYSENFAPDEYYGFLDDINTTKLYAQELHESAIEAHENIIEEELFNPSDWCIKEYPSCMEFCMTHLQEFGNSIKSALSHGFQNLSEEDTNLAQPVKEYYNELINVFQELPQYFTFVPSPVQYCSNPHRTRVLNLFKNEEDEEEGN